MAVCSRPSNPGGAVVGAVDVVLLALPLLIAALGVAASRVA
ncbi:MAG: hypothetical protein Q7T56_00550 [Nocardioidaceae bacterium]|nr:hypothetical protein [Nocardioidaceae bacterium]